MKGISTKAFHDEMRKIAFDPVTMAGGLALGKVMATNALSRFAHRIPPLRRIGQEIAGVGVRTALQGRPMLSSPMRHAMAIGVDPKAVSLYENAHAVGRGLRSTGIQPHMVGDVQSAVTHHPITRNFPQAAKLVGGVPLQSTGWRKALDYSFSPVSQVAQDAKAGVRSVAGRVVSGARRLLRPGVANG